MDNSDAASEMPALPEQSQPSETPQKDQAEQIIERIEASNIIPESGAVSGLLNILANSISKADEKAAIERVQKLRETHPDDPVNTLVERLIRKKCQQTAAVGAATSGAAVLPGIGTLASLTAGVAADIGATFKLQAELVLEIAEAHGRKLDKLEKHQVILLVTGVSAGGNQIMVRAGRQIALELTERYTYKWISHALPIIGVVAAAGTNVLSTYLIGQRAHAYFSLGEAAVGDWRESLRTISGIDERKIGSWFIQQGKNSWNAAQSGLGHVTSAVAQAGASVQSSVPDHEDMVRVTTSVAASLSHLGKTIADGGEATLKTVGKVGSVFKRSDDGNDTDDTDAMSQRTPEHDDATPKAVQADAGVPSGTPTPTPDHKDEDKASLGSRVAASLSHLGQSVSDSRQATLKTVGKVGSIFKRSEDGDDDTDTDTTSRPTPDTDDATPERQEKAS